MLKVIYILLVFGVYQGEPATSAHLHETLEDCKAVAEEVVRLSTEYNMGVAAICIPSPPFKSNEAEA